TVWRRPAGAPGVRELRHLPLRREHPLGHRAGAGGGGRPRVLAVQDDEALQVSRDRHLHSRHLRAGHDLRLDLRAAAGAHTLSLRGRGSGMAGAVGAAATRVVALSALAIAWLLSCAWHAAVWSCERSDSAR